VEGKGARVTSDEFGLDSGVLGVALEESDEIGFGHMALVIV